MSGSGFVGEDREDDVRALFFQYSEANGAIDAIALYTANDESDGYVLYSGSRGSNVVGANATLTYTSAGGGGKVPMYLSAQGVTFFFERSGSSNYKQVSLRPATFADYQRAAKAAAVPALSSSAASGQSTCNGPSASSSAQTVAEGTLRAALANDFRCAKLFFAPDRQANSWFDIIGGALDVRTSNGTSGNVANDVSGCQGVSYSPVERQMQVSGVPYSEITFLFSSPCIKRNYRNAGAFGGDPYATSSANKLILTVEKSTGRWYVAGGEVPK